MLELNNVGNKFEITVSVGWGYIKLESLVGKIVELESSR